MPIFSLRIYLVEPSRTEATDGKSPRVIGGDVRLHGSVRQIQAIDIDDARQKARALCAADGLCSLSLSMTVDGELAAACCRERPPTSKSEGWVYRGSPEAIRTSLPR